MPAGHVRRGDELGASVWVAARTLPHLALLSNGVHLHLVANIPNVIDPAWRAALEEVLEIATLRHDLTQLSLRGQTVTLQRQLRMN